MNARTNVESELHSAGKEHADPLAIGGTVYHRARHYLSRASNKRNFPGAVRRICTINRTFTFAGPPMHSRILLSPGQRDYVEIYFRYLCVSHLSRQISFHRIHL